VRRRHAAGSLLLRLTTLLVLLFALALGCVSGVHAAATRHHRASRATVGVRAAKFARRWLGVRYRWGGTSPRGGFDCSGFVRFVWDRFGIQLAHSSYAQFQSGRWISRRALRPGDLVFFHRVGHVGIYIGHNRFVHAPHSGAVVSIASLSGPYGYSYVGARRVR
jgi:cell wall-associated NlpC family hydrolase